LPNVTLRFLIPDNPHSWVTSFDLLPVSISSLHSELSGRRTLLFGVPSPFAPECNDHLDSYLSAVPRLRQRGVNQVVCVSTADVFVLNAWRSARCSDYPTNQLIFASDGNGELCRRLDMAVDLTSEGMGASMRFRRFAMLIE
ncbi:hypothetical protein THASP1DRAFT_11107, partial [Thamnocephalis sphaerospora]